MNKVLIAFLLCFNAAAAQQIIINTDNIKSDKAALYSLEGETLNFIDSIKIINGEIPVKTDNLHTGLYRVSFDNKRIQFIYDKDDVEIEFDADNIQASLKIIKSASNRIYNEFIKLNKDYKAKSELLQLVLARYPEKDEYFNATAGKLALLQKEYLEFVNETAQDDPDSFTAKYIRSAQLPVVKGDIPADKIIDYLKTHSLDNVNFNDDELIFSDAFTGKTIEYLTWYRNPELPLELLEKEFMSAVDSLLGKARVNEIVYRHIVEYLLEGFKQYGFDNLLNYITANYVIKDDLCLDTKLEKALERRIQQTKIFIPGTSVPNILLPDPYGTISDLSKINTGKVLIVFYASWCPHCQTLLPEIYAKYKGQKEKKFEVLAVSIDTSGSDWQNFITNNNLDWLNVSDLQGWDGKSITDYWIYATPTMFIVDNKLHLLGMPKNLEEISLLVE